MNTILFAWLGNTDIKSLSGHNPEELGPIGQVIKERKYSHLCLLCNYEQKILDTYISEFNNLFDCNVEEFRVTLKSPTDFTSIYEAANKSIQEIKSKYKDNEIKLTYHLSPGTPAMASVWIIIANSVHPAELIESSREAGVKTVSIPFDIAADYIPNKKELFEKELIKLAGAEPPVAPEFSSIIHRCESMNQIIRQAVKLSQFEIPILLLGESGTGKELFARAIHKSSIRGDKKIVTINCGAIPQELIESELFGYVKGAFTGATANKTGLIEEADKSTLFLDEIGDLLLSAQVKLLRAIQEGIITPVGSTKEVNVDIRIIAATNRNLLEDVSKGKFREDLFHRIAVGVITLPPVRERQGDLSLLIKHFIEVINKKFSKYTDWKYKKLSAGAKNFMLKHNWPGNIRELQNALTRMILWAETEVITEEDASKSIFYLNDKQKDIMNLPIGNGFNINELISRIARHYLEKSLEKSGGNKSKATELLGLPNYQTFSNWCKKYGLE